MCGGAARESGPVALVVAPAGRRCSMARLRAPQIGRSDRVTAVSPCASAFGCASGRSRMMSRAVCGAGACAAALWSRGVSERLVGRGARPLFACLSLHKINSWNVEKTLVEQVGIYYSIRQHTTVGEQDRTLLHSYTWQAAIRGSFTVIHSPPCTQATLTTPRAKDHGVACMVCDPAPPSASAALFLARSRVGASSSRRLRAAARDLDPPRQSMRRRRANLPNSHTASSSDASCFGGPRWSK